MTAEEMMKDLNDSFKAAILDNIARVAGRFRDAGLPPDIAQSMAERLVVEKLNREARANWAGQAHPTGEY